MIQELNQDLYIEKEKEEDYNDAISDGVVGMPYLLGFEFIDLNELQRDYMEDYLDLIDQYRDDVETFSEKTSVKPPAFMALAAKVGLKIRDEQPKSNKCCMPTGLVRANQLAKRQNLSLKTIKRIKSFASRHGANIKAKTEKTSKLWQSLMLWGVPYSANFETAKKNVERVIKWCDRQIKSLEKN